MALLDTIESDFLAAQRAHDMVVVDTLRLLRAELLKKSKEPSMAGQPMTDELVLAIVQSQVKQRRESISEYTKGNRSDLAAREEDELAILNRYVPAQLTAEELATIVQRSIAEAGPSPQFGAVMGKVMKEVSGRADGTTVNQIVKDTLGES